MEANDRLIVNLFNNESFTLCKIDEVDANIKRAQEFYANDVETYKHHLIYFPNMSDHWQKQLEICESVLKAGFEAITWEEYVKRQREKWLSKEPKEITREEYDYALNVLPPKVWIQNERYSMFFIGECTTMTYYGQYLYDKVSGKYYYAMADIFDESTWLDKMLNLSSNFRATDYRPKVRKLINFKIMERNLLNIEITFRLTDGAIDCTTEEMKEHIRIQAGCIHKSYLHSFRKDESKPYLVWISSGYSGNGLAYVSFNIRLKSPYDEDFVVPAFRDLPHVRGIKSSWFPSRKEYGGTVQSDGTIIETWDI